MSQFIDQYFDLQFMGNHFHQVFAAFVTLTLSSGWSAGSCR